MRAGQLYETFSESDAYWLAMTLDARKASEDETGEEMEIVAQRLRNENAISTPTNVGAWRGCARRLANEAIRF